MTQMTAEQRDAFLRQTRIAKLVTLYPDGSPTAVPVWYEWNGGEARMFTARHSEKVRRIRSDPRVCLTGEEPLGVAEAWVTVEGTAAIEEEGALELAVRLARRYYQGEHAERTVRRWTEMADLWVVIRLTPRRIRSSAPDSE